MKKKGYLQTLEAVIVIVILVTLLVSFKFTMGEEKEIIPASVKSSQDFILNSILTSNEIRSYVIDLDDNYIITKDSNTALSRFISDNLLDFYDFKLQKCSDKCPIPEGLPSKSVYTTSIYMIIGTIPKTVYLYIYEK